MFQKPRTIYNGPGYEIILSGLSETYQNAIYVNELIKARPNQILIAIDKNQLADDVFEDEEVVIYNIYVQKQYPIRIASFNNNVADFYELEFQQNFRLKLSTFELILKMIYKTTASDIPVRGRSSVDLKDKVLSVIWLLVTNDSYSAVSERFHINKSVLSRYFLLIVNALNSMMVKYIKWPKGSELVAAKRKFSDNSIFQDLIGVIDGAYVPLAVPAKLNTTFLNRNLFTSMTLQAICDADMRFIDIYTGWPSSEPEITIFKSSNIYQRAQQSTSTYFPNREYILGNNAFPILDWCITPYLNNGIISKSQDLFNQKHFSSRKVIERSFALLFGRFRRLQRLDLHRTDWAPATIMACCVIHNICIDYDEDMVNNYIKEGLAIQAFTSTNEIQYNDSTSFNNGIFKRDLICRQISE